MQNSEQPDDQFLIEKKDKCCGKKCGCHDIKKTDYFMGTDNGMDNSVDCPDIYVIGGFILLVAAVVIILSII